MNEAALIIDGWRLDEAAHQLTKGDATRRIEPRALLVLVHLAAQPGSVVSRAELLDAVWGGAFVGDDAVSAAIIKLRRAFDDDARAPRVIETVHKSGYRLIADVIAAPGDQSDRAGDRSNPAVSAVKFATVLRFVFRLDPLESSPVSPEQWQRATGAVVAVVDEAISRHGGQSFHESAAVIGVFGAPTAHEHHATRAVQAAIDIRTMVSEAMGDGADGLALNWRLALASGELLSSPAQPDGRPTIHGAPVQRVAELAEAALRGEILLDGVTRELAVGLRGVRRCGSRAHQHDVGDAFSVDADAGWSSPWQARMDRGLSPLVGRDHEVDRLEYLLDKARSGHGQVVALSGEPGVGKSRLVHEALLLASAHEFEISVATASPFEAHTPFFPMREILIERSGLDPDALNDATGSVDATALLAALHPEDVSDDWLNLDPEARRSRSVTAFVEMLVQEDRPALIVVEDLHWVDESTLRLVEAIALSIARRPCALVVTHRPDFADLWTPRTYQTHLRVDALDELDSGRLLDHLVGSDATLRRWKSTVIGRTGGTPLFIEEVVRSARAAGALVGSQGELSLADALPDTHPPASVHALVAARIDRLSAGAQDVLSLAAAAGTDVSAQLLAALLPGTLVDHSVQIDELQEAELMFATTKQREASFSFKHALTQEVAYRSIPSSLRRDHHRRIAELLESNVSAGAQVSPELIARHRSGAEQHTLALEAWVRAADSAVGAAAFSDAIDHLDHARASLAHLDADQRADSELSIELALGSALVQHVGPADPAVHDAYLTARRLAASAGTAPQQFEAAWGLWFVHLMRGEINVARQLGDELFDLAGSLDDQALELEAHHVQWSGLSLAGDPIAVRQHSEVGIERYRSTDHHWMTYAYGGHDPGVCSRNLNAMALWLLGEPEGARRRSAAAVALADDLGHPYSRLESFNSAFNIALLDGDAYSLHEHAGVIDELVSEGLLPDVAHSYADGFRANALVLDGEAAAGLDLMERVAPIWQEFWGAWCFPLDSAYAATLGRAGDTMAAIDQIERRLADVEVSGAHWWDAEFDRVLGELLWADDHAAGDRAEAHLRRALEQAHGQEARFLELRAGTSLARLRRDRADPNGALELLTRCCDLFRSDADLTDLRAAWSLRGDIEAQLA